MANINAELSIVDSNGDVNVIYPKTYATNVFMADGTTVEAAVNDKAASSHTHDSRYYTETEIDNMLAAKANLGVIPVNPSDTSDKNIWVET